MAGLSVLFAVSVFCVISLVRLMIRRSRGQEVTGQRKAVWLKCCFLSHQVIFWFATFACCIGWSLIAWSATGKRSALIIGICGSLCVLSLLQCLLYLATNEFDYFQDIDKLNRRIDNHNKEIAKIEKIKIETQEKILAGSAYSPSQTDLPETPLASYLLQPPQPFT